MATYKKSEARIVHKTGLKKHHKIFIGSFTTIVIIFMIVTAVLLNGLIVKQTLNHNEISNELDNFKSQTQTQINELTDMILSQEDKLQNLGSQVGTIDQQFAELKASVDEDFSGIIENSVESVFTIRTDVGQGTGFAVAEGGFIVTNAHVLSGGRWVQAIDYQQEILNAELVGYDSTLDIALLKINDDYPFLDLANSNKVQIGERVIAIGNPLGLQFSVSQGIVSGVHRQGPSGIEAYIQTDAALNPGNSGGPLINNQRNVIGINNFKIGSGESLGFALESNFIKTAINTIYQEAVNESLV